MTEFDDLARAIEALDAQRPQLGDATVDAALAPLRARLAGLRADVLGEQRRLVSIVFADLVGFTPMAAAMDPEDVGEVMKAYFQRWSASIRRQGGVVAKFIGDAVLAVFGFPVAHEDDAERAVLAAMEMKEELAELNRELEFDGGPPLAMRVGINTGEVVVSLLGEAGREELTVVGDAVNLASRVQTSAPEGEILVTADTARHVAEGFELTPFGDLDLKGIAQPVTTSIVRAARPRTFRLSDRSLGLGAIRMVGRARELELLQSAYSRAQEGRQTQAVTVVGEPGIGKSRLLQEFDEWLRGVPGVAVFRGRAHRSTQLAPLALLRDAFADHAGIQDSDRPDTVRRRLNRELSAVTGDDGVETRSDLIARLLGFEVGSAGQRRGSDLDQETLRNLAVGEILTYFRAIGHETAGVLLLEDLHWADEASLELIQVLASDQQTSMLVLTSARPELLLDLPEWGEGSASGEIVHLGPLTPEDGKELVTEMLPGRLPILEALDEMVLRAADGNPFYIEELIKMLVEDGVVYQREDVWQLSEGGLGGVPVPPTLMEVLQARFDTLGPDQRRCLQRGSVIGRVFWDKGVDAISAEALSSAGVEMSSAPVLAALHTRDMVSQVVPSTFEGTDEYLFKHSLLRDVSYSTLLKRQRRAHHLTVARWLGEISGRAGRASEFSRVIADHYREGDARAEAAEWYLRAGRAAAGQFANQAALDAYGRALDTSPDPDPRWRTGVLLEREEVLDLLGERSQQLHDLETLETLAQEIGPEMRAQVAFRMARYHLSTADYDAVLDQARLAEKLAMESSEDIEMAARCAVLQAATLNRRGEVDDSALHARRALDLVGDKDLPGVEADAHRQLGLVAYYTGEVPEALHRFARALDLYREAGDKRGEATAILNLGGANFDKGDHQIAEHHYQQSLAVTRAIGDRIGEARALHNLGIIAVTRGDYTLAEQHYLETLATVRETGNRSIELMALDNLGNLAQYRYRYSEAERYLTDCVAGARELGDKLTEANALINLGRCDLAVGKYEAAQRESETALALAETMKDPVRAGMALNNLARCELGFDQFELAHRRTRDALGQVSPENRSERAESMHFDGAALHGLGRLEEALDRYRRAVELRSQLDEPRELLESRAAMADVMARQGHRVTAVQEVSEILILLDGDSGEGFEDPAALFLHCHQVLAADADRRAGDVLRRGHEVTQAVASRIEDDEMRRSYLTRVPSVRDLTAAWAAWNESS